ncbi:MAG: glycosyltransferase family protein [Alphaproteobacteria bacterium]|nr:glycosyltransferase family protein [Alphaproteobacteria bacterium]
MQSAEPAREAGPGPELPAAPSPPPSPDDRIAALLATAAGDEAAGRLDEAATTLRQVLAAAPHHPAASHQLGIVLFRKGRLDEAAELMEQSIAGAPDSALFHRNLCEVYRALGRYPDAVVVGRRAVALDPADLHCHHNLGVLHYDRLDLDAAIACAEAALAIDPEFPGAHFGIAEASLLRGDFARGWEEYEWRFRLAGVPALMPPTDRPQWDGAPLGRGERLLLVADQGYGDVIQFARYIPWAAARCAEIAVACSAELIPVIAQQEGVGTVFDHWDKKPDFAAYSALSGLPRLAHTVLETIPAQAPYLRADPARAANWADRLGALLPRDYRRIGIVWAGRPTHRNDRKRSVELGLFAPLARLPRVALVSLQKGPAQRQIGTYWGRAPLLNLGPEIRDYADTIAALECLDLVVAVDTSIVHVAGAMGKPVWIMLPYAPDWRWLLGRSDSPWYPTARLFRQSEDRQWPPVMATIASEAAALPR